MPSIVSRLRIGIVSCWISKSGRIGVRACGNRCRRVGVLVEFGCTSTGSGTATAIARDADAQNMYRMCDSTMTTGDQVQEHQDRMRHLVADPLDAVQHLLHERLAFRRLAGLLLSSSICSFHLLRDVTG